MRGFGFNARDVLQETTPDVKKLTFTFACFRYDRLRALIEGRAEEEGWTFLASMSHPLGQGASRNARSGRD